MTDTTESNIRRQAIKDLEKFLTISDVSSKWEEEEALGGICEVVWRLAPQSYLAGLFNRELQEWVACKIQNDELPNAMASLSFSRKETLDAQDKIIALQKENAELTERLQQKQNDLDIFDTEVNRLRKVLGVKQAEIEEGERIIRKVQEENTARVNDLIDRERALTAEVTELKVFMFDNGISKPKS